MLVIGELVDVAAAPKRHFSAVKGLHLGEALAAHGEVDHLTTGASSWTGALSLRSLDELPPLHDYDLVVMMRETNLMELLVRVPGLHDLLVDKKRSTTVVARGDSFAWLGSRALGRRYRNEFERSLVRDAPTMFDVVCAQTPELVEWSLAALPRRLRHALRRRTLVSPMGVPAINHRVGRPNLPSPAGQPVELLYMGRLKTDGGRSIAFLREVMRELGPGFVLHVYPGSFVLPDAPRVVHRPSNPASLERLRQQFNGPVIATDNVVVHEPFDLDRKVDVVTRHAIGLDLSPARPFDRRHRAANAKLLEYCWLGLAVVTETNAHNSALVLECGNGERLAGVPSAAEYADAVRRVAASVAAGSHDPVEIAGSTIGLHGWDGVAATLAGLSGLRRRSTPTAEPLHAVGSVGE
jgi:hypothetical protein